MSKCCCCLSVTTGATILGLIGILMGTAELVLFVPYLIEAESFNPMRKEVGKMVQHVLPSSNFSKEEINEGLRAFILVGTISSGLYALLAFFLVIGIQFRKRVLMTPYIIVQMAATAIFGLLGIAGTILFFILDIIAGFVCGVSVLVISYLLIYFWMVVQRAYVDLWVNGN
jgi:hypothetical protein